jgi:hypothetical protein
MYEVVYIVHIDPKETTVIELPDDAIITHMTFVATLTLMTEVELLMKFYYTDGTIGDYKIHFTSKSGIMQWKSLDAEDFGEIMYRSVMNGFLKQKIVPRPKKIKRIEVTTSGRGEHEITLYIRFYSNKEEYPLYEIVKSEKYSPIQEVNGKVIMKLKYIPSPFEW